MRVLSNPIKEIEELEYIKRISPKKVIYKSHKGYYVDNAGKLKPISEKTALRVIAQ